jgi:hypothetical protein
MVERPEHPSSQQAAKNALMMDEAFIKTPFSENQERAEPLRLEAAWPNTS